MIHILDKIYLTYAETSVGPGSYSRLPEKYIRIVDRGLTGMSHEVYDRNQISFSKSVDRLIKEHCDCEKLFENLLDEKRLIIYADENATLEFLCRFWQGLFPNITAKGAYALYKIFADSETLRPHKSNSFLNITADSSDINFNKFSNLYWNLSEADFKRKFPFFKPFNLPADVKRKCSVEYLIMDYMANGQEQMSPALEAKIRHLYEKAVIREIAGVKRISQEFLYHLALKDEDIKAGGKLDGVSLKESLLNTKYAPLLDVKIDNTSESYRYVKEAYNMTELSETLISIETSISEELGLDRNGVELDNPCMCNFVENGEDPDMKELLDKEIEGKSRFRLLTNLARVEKLNSYIIPAFANLLEDENQSLSEEFKL